MIFESRHDNVRGLTLLRAKGKCTISDGAEALRNEVTRLLNDPACQRTILLNCREITKIDSTGVGELFGGADSCFQKGKLLRLVDLSQSVCSILTQTCLISAFTVYETEEDAFEACGSRAAAPAAPEISL